MTQVGLASDPAWVEKPEIRLCWFFMLLQNWVGSVQLINRNQILPTCIQCRLKRNARFLDLQAIKCGVHRFPLGPFFSSIFFHWAHQFWVSPMTSRSVVLHWKKICCTFLCENCNPVCNTLSASKFLLPLQTIASQFFQLCPINASEQITYVHATFFDTNVGNIKAESTVYTAPNSLR